MMATTRYSFYPLLPLPMLCLPEPWSGEVEKIHAMRPGGFQGRHLLIELTPLARLWMARDWRDLVQWLHTQGVLPPPYCAGLQARGVDLHDAYLSLAFFGAADFSEADFSGACLHFACLALARLNDAVFAGADLCGADLSQSSCMEASFKGAGMYQVRALQVIAHQADFTDAVLIDSNLCGGKFRCARFCGARMRCARLRNADLVSADFTGADTTEADFRGAFRHIEDDPIPGWRVLDPDPDGDDEGVGRLVPGEPSVTPRGKHDN